jgi:predicted lysophospholipase L1 biosynthesis ABC-type transport system permease subunit
MGRQYWPHSDPIGKGFRWGGRPFQVVGIVEDIHVKAIDEPVGPAIYFSAFQMETHTLSSGVFLMRTRKGFQPSELVPAVRKAIWSIDPAVPILGFTDLQEVVSSSLATRRASLVLAAAFALVALILALAGIYSVFSQAVSQRTREIGLRLALGAQPHGIRRQLRSEGIRLMSWGITAGALFSLLAVRFLSNLLFGVRPLDPESYLASVLAVLGIALLGIEAPARRASHVDPLLALRDE